VAGELRRHFPSVASNVLVIPNGVDCGRFRPDAAVRHSLRRALGLSDRELVVLFVGSEWGRKGLAPLVEALAHAPSWQLVVVGKGDTHHYRAMISRLGLTARVLFIGEVRDTAPYYAAADAFALPSSYETFSLATYEAGASGLPLLATRVSGIEDLLVDGYNGWFIDRRPTEIARRLEQLAGDGALRGAMGERSRAAALGFGWERVPGAYADLYRSVADERPGRSRHHR
jgi:UDP-glucose:(heptosyl)LPS alpha-1,3-glucosyltransferase